MAGDQFRDKVAIVTGASSGIGKAASMLMAQEGARLVLASRREEELAKVASTIESTGGEVVYLAGDVGDESYVREVVELAVKSFGKIDIAINNAGALGKLCGLGEMELEDWEHTINTNLTSGFLCAKYQLPHLLETQGNFIFTSSFVGYTAGLPGMSAYGASKAGLIGLVKCLAAEIGDSGVRVNALLPGGTDTPMASATASSDEQLDQIKGMHALKRIAQPEEIAKAICFLASESASFITGSAMLADGGVSIYKA